MQPKLSEYLSRFKSPNQSNSPKQFFTQLASDNYFTELPFLYEIEIFCLRLIQAKINQETICIYSDYDTDAVTATASMYWGLLELGFKKSKIDFYAPDRFTEGYGMNTEAAYTLSQEYDLIISVDCGINSTAEAEIIAASPADLLITDHHHLRADLPVALAVLNPRVGERFIQDPDFYLVRQKIAENNFTSLIANLPLAGELIGKIKNWKLELDKADKNLMSTSVTGVGVAWFSLVWLAYFLEACDL